ncbi:heavy metal-binding domain-containing protein [Lutibacter citreus]|uniref:heavy metal-binding domain-containing protein n=1 Tax=Lutibacter citreus TaxID=2138210 RepID=UPI000DBE9988|nr:heavy metal-binding domain-containing protein [Lutibacter citreus]
MKTVFISIAIIALIVLTGCKTDVKKDKEPVKTEEKMETVTMEVYQCPMDCEKGKTYEKPGSCPVCKMDLKKVKKNTEDHSDHNH